MDIVYKRLVRPARELTALKIKNVRRRNAGVKFGARNLGSVGGGLNMASKAWFDKSGDSSSPATHSASPERR